MSSHRYLNSKIWVFICSLIPNMSTQFYAESLIFQSPHPSQLPWPDFPDLIQNPEQKTEDIKKEIKEKIKQKDKKNDYLND